MIRCSHNVLILQFHFPFLIGGVGIGHTLTVSSPCPREQEALLVSGRHPPGEKWWVHRCCIYANAATFDGCLWCFFYSPWTHRVSRIPCSLLRILFPDLLISYLLSCSKHLFLLGSSKKTQGECQFPEEHTDHRYPGPCSDGEHESQGWSYPPDSAFLQLEVWFSFGSPSLLRAPLTTEMRFPDKIAEATWVDRPIHPLVSQRNSVKYKHYEK